MAVRSADRCRWSSSKRPQTRARIWSAKSPRRGSRRLCSGKEILMAKQGQQFSYGGQAVIEGVMMRGAHKVAIAVRNPKGEIVIHEEPLNAALYRGRIARTPFLRGLVGLWDALGLGTRALMWSADVAIGEEEGVSFSGPVGYGTLIVSLVFGVGLFFLIPTAAASGLERLFNLQQQSF